MIGAARAQDRRKSNSNSSVVHTAIAKTRLTQWANRVRKVRAAPRMDHMTRHGNEKASRKW